MRWADKFKEVIQPKTKEAENPQVHSEEIVHTQVEQAEVFETGWNLAQLICYHHREGMTVEDIVELAKTSEDMVLAVVSEAKDTGVYDSLADELKYYKG